MVAYVSDKFQLNESDSVNMDKSHEEYNVKKDHVSTLQYTEIEKLIKLLISIRKELKSKDLVIADLQKQKDQYLTQQKDHASRNILKDNYIKILANSYSLRIGRGVGKFIPDSVCHSIKRIFSGSGNQFQEKDVLKTEHIHRLKYFLRFIFQALTNPRVTLSLFEYNRFKNLFITLQLKDSIRVKEIFNYYLLHYYPDKHNKQEDFHPQPAQQKKNIEPSVVKDRYEAETFPRLCQSAVKPIAFYLPQFHPIPENDRWWGKGFTEWTNVTKARPLFKGHYQPHLPGELGFYDLRVIDVMKRQVELAKQYGIYGFCFYHYWFAGRRLLEGPLNQFLEHAEIDFPFCLCWANENWTRRWDGLDQEILIAQDHSPEDDMAFIRDLGKYLRDPRYIKVDNKPFIIVYNPGRLPDAKATVQRWREYCRASGIGEIYLVMAQTFGIRDPRPFDFDAAVEFPPHVAAVTPEITNQIDSFEDGFEGRVYNYADIPHYNPMVPQDYVVFKCVMTSWDNTPRTGRRGTVFIKSSPTVYQDWVEKVLAYTTTHNTPSHWLIFINAWNEWAEGAHLEPDTQWGYGYLNATARALQSIAALSKKKYKVLFVSNDAFRAGAQILFLHLLRWIKEKTAIEPKIVLCSGGVLEESFREIGDIIVLDKIAEDFRGQDQIANRISEFCGSDIKLIYANTVATGKYFECLKMFKVPIVTHVHELQKSIEKFAGQSAMNNVIEKTDKYIVASPAVGKNLTVNHNIPEEKIETVYAFIANHQMSPATFNKAEHRETLHLDQGKVLIWGCGTVDWRKGPDLFISVAGHLLKKGFQDFHFYWIGLKDETEYPDIENDINRWGLDKYVTFLGEKQNPQEYFMAGDIFLLTSREDPFPLVCLEAAECGLPTICFAEAGSMPDFVEVDAGLVVPYQNIEEMADKLSLIIKDPARRAALGERAREKFLERHTLDSAAPHILKVIRNVSGIKPAVSVIVPCYNHAPFLKQRLDSIFCQTFQDFEVITLDDCSTDESLSILQEYRNRPNVSLFANQQNLGTFAQWLKGIQAAKADIIWIAEDDDYCEPEFLETLLPFFNDAEIRLAYCNSHAVDDQGNVTRDLYVNHYYENLPKKKWHQDYKNSLDIELNHGLAIKNTIPNVSAVLFRKLSISEDIESRLRKHTCGGDWMLYLHVLKDGAIAHSQKTLNYHRRHAQSVVAKNMQSASNTIPDYLLIHEYVLMNYLIERDVMQKMVEYVSADLRNMFPDLTDAEFSALYDAQYLWTIWEQQGVPKKSILCATDNSSLTASAHADTTMLNEDYSCPLPTQYIIEPGTICNLRCPFCPTGMRWPGLSKGFMSLENYQIILDKIAPYAEIINLFNYGEPLLNKDIVAMISMTARKGVKTSIHSNLTAYELDEKKAGAIIESGLSILSVSIDGASQSTYSQYRRGGNLELVMKNIEQLQTAKLRLNAKAPDIVWSFLINKYNEHEQDQAKKTAAKLGIRITFNLMDIWGDASWESTLHKTAKKELSALSLKQDGHIKQALPIPVNQITLSPYLHHWCRQPFDTLIVNWNGKVLPCCAVYDEKLALGNLLEEDLEDLWNSDQFRGCRQFLYNYGPKQNTNSVCETLPCPLSIKHI